MRSMMKQEPTKRIVLGITGGIAAYKAAELLRLLMKQGIEVQVAMSEAACHFITSAMNREMWMNAATQRNIKQLLADGVQVLGPDSGVQACGEEGMGRMLEAVELARDVIALLLDTPFSPVSAHRFAGPASGAREMISSSTAQPLSRKLSGKKILITAGPTYEAIDTVRGITNRSSGKMGYAIAQAALELGAKVVLVSGPTSLAKPQGIQSVDVQSAAQMFDAVKQHLTDCDIFIGVAAVADYRVAQASAQKIKKSADNLTLELVPNPDILAYVANLPNPPFCVGFAAESENLVEYAEQKRRAKKLPLLVANLVQQAVGSDDNELVLSLIHISEP